ncbi:hypothetical protein FQZ97_1072260 [compost metagenome]
MFSTRLSEITGRQYPFFPATRAKDSRASSAEITRAFSWMAVTNSAAVTTSSLKIRNSISWILLSAVRIFSSYTFSSSVMYRSAFTRVCFRIHSWGTLSLWAFDTSR